MFRPTVCVAVLAAITGMVPAAPQDSRPVRLEAGEIRPYLTATPHPYPLGDDRRPVVWTDRVHSPGATLLRLHFKDFDLAPGDYLVIRDPQGRDVHRYEGRGPYGDGEFWSFATQGDVAILRLHGGRGLGNGYAITEVAHGTLPDLFYISPQVVCGTDGRRNVACYDDPPRSTFDPVALLSFVDDLGFAQCTGFLVAGSRRNTLMTNWHCIGAFTSNPQAVVRTMEARFNHQNRTCTGSQLERPASYAGGTFLKTSGELSLDYTLLTLKGNAEHAWGEFLATTLEPGVGSIILFPQHPGGGVKLLGKYDDVEQTVPCSVSSVHCDCGVDPGTQFSYACDSEGGASGSPILNAAGTRVWGLHHLADVRGAGHGCNNAGAHMSLICADAGPLLSCAAD